MLNASPDIRAQLTATPALHPRGKRTSPVEAVLLTDAELDHTLGLLLLREGGAVEIHATAAVHDTLCRGTAVLATLETFATVTWRRVVPGADMPLGEALTYRAFCAPTDKRPRYGVGGGDEAVVGYRITDTRTGRALVYLPGVQQLTAAVRAELDDCACLLVDGTCWTDDELIRLGLADKTAHAMGHLAIDGPNGSLHQLAPLPIDRKIYVHINNTNPILLEDSPERRVVTERGFEVAEDGLEVGL